MADVPVKKLLVVDDAADTRELLSRNLASQGYAVSTASGVAEAIEILAGEKMDLVITDLKMPGATGLDLIQHVRESMKDTEVMMITGYPSIESAVTAVKSGAEEYLSKPFTQEELFAAVGRSMEKLGLRRVAAASAETPPGNRFGMVGESDAMRRVFKGILKTAATNATVLITGESGTGKELVARAIHYNGPRATALLVPINCGAIPEDLLESELFGHVKGAFTGAIQTRAGFFQTADGGTIFLDEVSEMSQSMQVKLLRVLQDREVYMVGATKAHVMDVRILAATNKALPELVQKGVFREDLYYRLDVITITVPPLRERGDDVLSLARHFVTKYAREYDKPEPRFSNRALEALRGYPWPGNVRELMNLIQRLVVMTDGDEIDVPDFPHYMRYSALWTTGLARRLEDVEAEYIRNVVAGVGGNKTRAASILGIDRKTLREKLKEMRAD